MRLHQEQPVAVKVALVLHDYPKQNVEKLWRDFLKRIDSPAHYDAPEYFLEPYWAGKRPFAVLALDRGRVIGVLTGLHGKNEVACGVPSRPQIQVDPNAAPEATGLLVEGLLEEAQNEALITVFSWGDAALPGFEQAGFHGRELEGDVVLDLSLGSDALFRQFHENRKRNIRSAIKNGVEVSESRTEEDLAGYWSVYSTWRQTKRKKIVHNHSFRTIEQVHGLPRNHLRFLARFQGKVIAATGLRFLSGGLVEYANNCSLDEFMHLRPNDLILWKTIQWACEQGFTKYSMGGAHPFLRKSGGTVVPIYRYRLDRSFLQHHSFREHIRGKIKAKVQGMFSNWLSTRGQN
jgi:hypothetical protein